MIVINSGIIFDAQQKYVDAKEQLGAWYYEAKNARWISFAEIKRKYSSASQFKNGKIFIVIFNIKGNDYRLAVRISYKLQTVIVLKFGTHAEYDKWTFIEEKNE